MSERTLDHVGIAVPSLDEAIATWAALTEGPAAGRETVLDQGVEVVFVGSGHGRVELLAPTRADSPIARFLDRRGPGLHHLCYRVPDLRSALAAHASAGFELIDLEPRRGTHDHLVAFLHPRTSGGVLVELLEKRDRTVSAI
ncbi:MAG: methylmalonyl-CoA epimerase [Gemmatimonas sp.]|nr:methylmalonyl-CoA epimerase [Gemmatimonas sp.]